MLYALIPVAILVVLFIWFMAMYNSLVSLQAFVQEAWSGIDVQLKRRYDLIPNLVEIVKGYSIHEQNIIDNIVRMRAASMGATSIEDKESAEIGLASSLKTLFALSEQYPNLKANENFLELQKELSVIEGELQLSRRYYNGAVRNYNIYAVQFPSSLIAKQFGFVVQPYFEVSSSEEKQTPEVKF